MSGKLISIFKQIEDNRRDLSKLHELNDILVMAIITKNPPHGRVSSCFITVKFSFFNAAAIYSKTALFFKLLGIIRFIFIVLKSKNFSIGIYANSSGCK